jgi:hypothetical protein
MGSIELEVWVARRGLTRTGDTGCSLSHFPLNMHFLDPREGWLEI